MNKSLASLTSHQVGLLKKSFRQLNTEQVANDFYSRLFTQYPAVKHFFPTDMSDLSTKLMSVFELVVFSFEEKKHDQFLLQDALIVPLRELGRKHDAKGIEPKHYTIANDLLLETMRDAGKDFFTSEVADAWKLALDQLTAAMLDRSVKTPPQFDLQSGKSLRDAFMYIRDRILNKTT
jgi:hemoglobin-like flavoprotein